ncbi:Uncharacterized protein Adt_31492 [Abeliophyllum distichum]|uniref:Uncharacterized protein n=1 Tax=Abeliophyllum distichum TaxID=126358 RepID=A0ABD1RF16_9LAMI
MCSPGDVASLGGNKYFDTFVDDASRKLQPIVGDNIITTDDDVDDIIHGDMLVDEIANQGEQILDEGEDEESHVRMSTREHVPSSRYPTSDYILLTTDGELESLLELQIYSDKVH